jgi:eukaryotic-like serine/threonine-protein kinase
MPTGLATPSAAEAARRRSPSSSPVGRLASADSLDAGGFTPGLVLAERYRIIGLLGRGGMGEVYRADDLKLGQPVALKFLPKALSEDPVRRERFYAEVRIARQVSHPNVCRVYDVAEFDGHHCLSMEYVDGEDLASLLKRIGRLPPDKALEIARQLCAGLAAAHDKGVLHRDLKPANVMIDGRGRARITDFGLAVAGEETGEREISGTPAYMAPEQLEGKGASVRSDIYALGLVLYELYTGRKAFDGASFAELKRKHSEEMPPTPSSVSPGFDPVVERVILRCLEKDPRARPISALQVASALPGGDPLAAALAAGETPSPEMVAASGATEGLSPAAAWACLAAIAVGAALGILAYQKIQLFRRLPLEEPPEVLAKKATEIIRKAGYADPVVGRAFGFRENEDFFRYVREKDKSRTRWDNLETGALEFWYRQSPRELEPERVFDSGEVLLEDPPPDVSGMATVRLNPRGRLIGFLAVPPQVEEAKTPAATPPDWSPLFSEAGLDAAKWTPVEPRWIPRTFADTRAAWAGALPDRPGVPMRIEAAAYRGKPVSFEIVAPWTRAVRMKPSPVTPGERALYVIGILILICLVVGGCLLARRNIRMGRGDRRGATRLALAVFALETVSWIIGGRHVATFFEALLVIRFLSLTLFMAGLAWVLYVALEPYVRRRWPGAIVSWSRVLAGDWRDALVGRDVLMGCLMSVLFALDVSLAYLVPSWLGSPIRPRSFALQTLHGGRAVVGFVLDVLASGIFAGLALLFVLFLLRMLLRRQWAAAAVFVAIIVAAASSSAQGEAPLLFLAFPLVAALLWVFILTRLGLVAAIVNFFCVNLLTDFPITTEASAWYAGFGFAALLVFAAIALYGFFTSLGGRPAFGSLKLED